MALLLMLIAATALALAWLLARTQAGRLDAASGDAIAAAAIVGAAVPAWAAWQAARLHALGATTGQARLGLAVEGAPMRRVARFLLHPASLPLWSGWPSRPGSGVDGRSPFGRRPCSVSRT